MDREDNHHHHHQNIDGKSYWKRSFADFYPEPSFQSWPTYLSALSQTPLRLADRLVGRSTDAAELGELRQQSEHSMKRCLSWWDIIWFGIGSVIGAGIFVLTGQEARNHAGPAIVLAYITAGISAMLSVFCYTEFSVEIPVAGGAFAYARVELGDFAAFIAAYNLLFQSVIGTAAVARAWTSYLATLLNKTPNSLRIKTSLADQFNLLDPIAVTVVITTTIIAMNGTKKASSFNWISSIIHVLLLAFIIIAGFAYADAGNLTPFLPYGAQGIFKAAAIVFFAYGGFDNLSTMAEETRNPAKDIPIGLVGSMTAITGIYCLMALVLSMMQSYTEIDPNAAFSLAFKSVGMNWAQYIVAVCALKGMTTVLLVGTVGNARYITHIARSHVIPPFFSLVHPKTGTPIYATFVVAFATACICFFSNLSVLASLNSLSNLFVYMMTAVALLFRRYCPREEEESLSVANSCRRSRKNKFLIFMMIILVSSVGTSAYWGLRPDGWVGYTITIPMWFAGTAGIQAMVPPCRKPKVWGVPLVPWLPSLSIAMNLFLMGSLGSGAFLRYGIGSGVMLIYYIFFGVHATYDVAHGFVDRKMDDAPVEEGKKMEENVKELSSPYMMD